MPQETNVQMHKAFKCLILTDLSAELPSWIKAQMTLRGESSTDKSYVLAKMLWKHKNRPPTPESLHAHPHTVLYSQERDTKANMWRSCCPSPLRNTCPTKASPSLHPGNSLLSPPDHSPNPWDLLTATDRSTLCSRVSAGMFFNYLWKVWTVYHH